MLKTYLMPGRSKSPNHFANSDYVVYGTIDENHRAEHLVLKRTFLVPKMLYLVLVLILHTGCCTAIVPQDIPPHLQTIDGVVYQASLGASVYNVSSKQSATARHLDQWLHETDRDKEVRQPWKNRNNKGGRLNGTPAARPPHSLKETVEWFEGSHSFAYRGSPDTRLLIRHAPHPQAGSPWPMPQKYSAQHVLYMVNHKYFRFNAVGETCDILQFNFERVYRNIFGRDMPKESDSWWRSGLGGGGTADDFYPGSHLEIRQLNVSVLKECDTYPSLESDESYDLEVKRSGASIIAREVWGAIRGLETFSQIVYQNRDGLYVVNKTLINDFPRFKHRGILIDTSRHFISKPKLLDNLELMTQNKMNVFHWHIVDDESFPFESKTYPNLTKEGAYDPDTHVYTHEDVADIIDQARLRGIRVIPEFDTPGHTFSWGFGQDYLLTPCYDFSKSPDGYYGPINPILKSTYIFLKNLYKEIISVFPDRFVHLGGDEVPFDCWESNPQIMKFINRNNLTDVRDVQSLYERKLLDLVTDIGKRGAQNTQTIVWQEVFDNNVKMTLDTVIQIWMGDAGDLERVTSAGMRAIYSTCWYLDYISYGQDWDKYYRCEQLEQIEDFRAMNESLILGGEACLWTEYADDQNILTRLWPRATAAAERLWSSRSVRDEIEAAPRIEEQRCRMLRRGLSVGVLSGPGHCPREFLLESTQLDHARQRFHTKHTKIPPLQEETNVEQRTFQRPTYSKVYFVDMNSMYLIPMGIVLILCCMAIYSLSHDSRSRVVAILKLPVNVAHRRNGKSMLFIFFFFVVGWCVWSAPLWLRNWENSYMSRAPYAHVRPARHATY